MTGLLIAVVVLVAATPVTVKSRVSHNSDYATTDRR